MVVFILGVEELQLSKWRQPLFLDHDEMGFRKIPFAMGVTLALS